MTPQGIGIGEPRLRLRGSTKTQAPVGCGGVARFGQIYRCSSLTGSRLDVFTLTMPVASDILYGTVTQSSRDDAAVAVEATVYDAGGSVVCRFWTPYPGSCQLKAAGTYTAAVSLTTTGKNATYTFAVQSAKAPSPCMTLDDAFFSFASAGRPGYLPRGSAGDCYTFDQPVGSVLNLWGTGGAIGEILDANYQPLCPIAYSGDCTLTTPGPYHLLAYDTYGNERAYQLRMARISHSAGCPELRPAAFGDPGPDINTGTLDSAGAVACHKLRAPAAGGVAIRVVNDRVHLDQDVGWHVYDDTGRQVCDNIAQASSCPLPAAGDYTIVTTDTSFDPVSYHLAVAALYQSAGCAGASLAWDQGAVVVHQTVALQTDCQEFRGAAGQRVVKFAASTEGSEVNPLLVDGAGHTFCGYEEDEDGCVLPADGIYRVVTHLGAWDPSRPDETYHVQVRSLTSPQGCPVVLPGAYNAPPSGTYGPIRCRTVRVAEPGLYRMRAYDLRNNRQYASVYDRTGHRVCTAGSDPCALPAAGDYTLTLDGNRAPHYVDDGFAYVTSVLPWQPAGCPVLTQELYRDTLTDAGQFLCVQLPEPTGARIAELAPAGGTLPFTYVMDSAGHYVCDSSYTLWQGSCELTGTAPYFAVLSEREDRDLPPGPFTTRFLRTDVPPSCPVLDDSPIATGGDDFSVCRTLPGDAHGARELFSWPNTSGTGAAYLSVFGANGMRYCGPWTSFNYVCDLPAGPVTVILDAGEAAATYQVSHVPYQQSSATVRLRFSGRSRGWPR